MNTAVVKFDTLTDTVGTAAKDHDLRFVLGYRILIFCVVGGVIVSTVFCTAYMNAFPGFRKTKAQTFAADRILRHFKDLAQIFVREAILFSCDELFICRQRAFALQKSFFLFNQLFHLFDEPCFYLSQFVDLLHGGTLAQGLIHNEMTLAGRCDQQL